MTTFHRFQIADAPFYRKAAFDFTENRITVVTGHNHNTGSSNAAGKTLFFQYLRDFIFGTEVQQDRTRNGKWAFSWSTHRGAYHAVRTTKSGKESLSIRERLTGAREWTDMGVRELRTAREFIRDSIGYNEEEFDSLVFLDTRPHPLISGNTAARKEFFTKFFRLDQQDDMGKLINAKLSELNRARVELDTLKAERAATYTALKEVARNAGFDQEVRNVDFPDAALRHFTVTADLFREALARAQAALDRALLARGHAEMLDKYGDRLTALQRVCGGSLDGYADAVTTMQRKLKRQRAELTILQQRSTLEGQIRKYEARLLELGSSGVPGKELAAREAKVTQLRNEAAEYKADRAAIAAKIETLEAQHVAYAGRLRKLRRVQSFEDYLKAHADDAPRTDYDCPTCGQRVHVGDSVKAEEKRLRHAHAEAERTRKARLDEQEEGFGKLTDEIRALTADYEAMRQHAPNRKLLADAVEFVEHHRERVTQLRACTEQLKDARARLAELDSIDAEDVEDLHRSIERTEGQLAKLQAYRDIIEPLKAAVAYRDTHGMPETSKTARLLKETQSHNADIVHLDAARQRMEEGKATIDRLTARCQELYTELRDEGAYQLLSKAFSKRGGVRQHQINAICQRLEQLTNQYARLLFTEDYHFTFQLDTHFNILVERNASDVKGKKGGDGAKITSDVRRLSAAERKLFALVLIPALMSFVPKERRSNLLILDEPDANMHELVRESLVRFLPTLNRIVPNIIYITPHRDLLNLALQENVPVTHYEVTKKGSVSTLARVN